MTLIRPQAQLIAWDFVIAGSVVNYQQVLQATQANVVSVGFLVTIPPGNPASPVGVKINGVPCLIAGSRNLTLNGQTAAVESSNLNPLTTMDGKIIGNDGNELRLHGVRSLRNP